MFLLRRICVHPKKWTVRHIFQVFFISIILISLLVALIIYFPSSLDNTFLVAEGDGRNSKGLPVPAAADLYIRSYNDEGIQLEVELQIRTKRYGTAVKLVPLNEAPENHIKTAEVIERRRELAEEQRLLSFEVKGGWAKCSMYNCFDIHRCGRNGKQQLSIYIYPIVKFVVDGRPLIGDERVGISKEYYEFLDAIRRSPYYVPNPEDACMFVPSIDTFALGSKSSTFIKDLETALYSLEFWKGSGQNHLLVSMFPGNAALLTLETEAIIASSVFSKDSYRLGFHIPLISYSPFAKGNRSLVVTANKLRRNNVLAISAQGQLPPQYLEDSSDRILVLDYCSHTHEVNYLTRCRGSQVYQYPDILRTVDFCVIVKDLSSPALWDAMSVGCIPVIISDSQRLPFDEVIDWKMNAIILYENQIPHLSSILQSVSQKRKERLKSQVQFTFNNYFRNINLITSTLLQVLNDRVFSHSSRTLRSWNTNAILEVCNQPLFNPVIAPEDAGFTAVILAYERVASLFQVIERISLVPSLAKILIVWNNQEIRPPPYSAWPKISKSMKVVEMRGNKMSNRFFPFDEIETEAVFSLDDDIIMLTVDEIQFGFDTWREFSDRIVGFPSRSHVWDNASRQWKYDSEWTNEISMVLTGASFYHKYWHHAYTHEMPEEIRHWVDSRMNCEDIAMNFLVSARTGKSPIKVTPRKKFKCPTCSNNEMLSSDSSHMIERTDCINKFAQVYGYMPLVAAEYRVDPVLHKVDNLPKRFKEFNDVGSL